MSESESRAPRRDSDSRAPNRHRPLKRLLKSANDRFGVVLVFLILTFGVLACGFTSDVMVPITVALEVCTLLATFAAAGLSDRFQNRARVAGALCVTVALAALPGYGRPAMAAAAILNCLLVVVCPVVIARAIWRRHVIDVSTVFGAVCIYVLLGLMFAFLYTAMGAISPEFFVQTTSPTSADYVYFSFVTLTTVGYGDLTASRSVGRAFAIQEALLGQVYLVTVVALLVSNLGRNRGNNRPAPLVADTKSETSETSN